MDDYNKIVGLHRPVTMNTQRDSFPMLSRMRPFILATVFFLSCLAQSAVAHVIELQGQQLPGLVGQAMGSYGFFAVKDGQLQPVAYQWVPWSLENTPWFASDDELHSTSKANTIEPLTHLLLRFEDGSTRYVKSPADTIRPMAEIRVNYNQQQHFFYVVKNPYLHSTKPYVTFDPVKMQIKTTQYALFMDPKNMLDWKNFYYKGYQSPDGAQQSILDTMKLRLSAGVFTGHARITLTNDNLVPHIKEVINGSLAVLAYADTSLKVAGIKVLSIHNYFVIKPNQTDIYARFTLPGAAKLVLESPSVSISLDGNALNGSRLSTSWTGNSVATTDGQVSVTEKRMLNQTMPRNGWIYFDTGNHFSLLAQLQFSKNLNVPVSLVYQDSAAEENKPERFPGQQPNVGFSMQNLPFGEQFAFMVRLIYSNDSSEDSQQYARNLLSAPQVQYHGL